MLTRQQDMLHCIASYIALLHSGSDSSIYLRDVRISSRESMKHSIEWKVNKGEEVTWLKLTNALHAIFVTLHKIYRTRIYPFQKMTSSF